MFQVAYDSHKFSYFTDHLLLFMVSKVRKSWTVMAELTLGGLTLGGLTLGGLTLGGLTLGGRFSCFCLGVDLQLVFLVDLPDDFIYHEFLL